MPSSQDLSAKSTRFVTFRSVVFGALGLFMISGLSGFHDWVLRGTSMVGNQMPASAFFSVPGSPKGDLRLKIYSQKVRRYKCSLRRSTGMASFLIKAPVLCDLQIL